mmetsp:Transcript_32867/g.64440  ORF Transcript_32867/g.64440 Transcript_32867/m.64440 type:complete len:302 (-) Transcript_32867:5679-6584(-)
MNRFDNHTSLLHIFLLLLDANRLLFLRFFKSFALFIRIRISGSATPFVLRAFHVHRPRAVLAAFESGEALLLLLELPFFAFLSLHLLLLSAEVQFLDEVFFLANSLTVQGLLVHLDVLPVFGQNVFTLLFPKTLHILQLFALHLFSQFQHFLIAPFGSFVSLLHNSLKFCLIFSSFLVLLFFLVFCFFLEAKHLLVVNFCYLGFLAVEDSLAFCFERHDIIFIVYLPLLTRKVFGGHDSLGDALHVFKLRLFESRNGCSMLRVKLVTHSLFDGTIIRIVFFSKAILEKLSPLFEVLLKLAL